MTKRIFRSFCLVAGIVFLASLLLIMGVLYDYFSGMQRASLKQQIALAAQGIASCGTAYCDGLKADGLRITWIDASGKVLYDSDSDAASMENHLERAEVREALKQGYGESSRYSSTLMKRQFYAAQRLDDGTVVRLSVSQYSLLTLFMGMLPQIACVTLIAAVLSLLLASRLTKRIVKPLNDIDPEQPSPVPVYPELRPLFMRLEHQQQLLRYYEAETPETDRTAPDETAGDTPRH